MSTDIQKFNAEVTKELANPETMQTLVATVFRGLRQENVKPAIVEGMIRGFTFKDFLEKNVYAIPYGDKYSLVTSIDYARKVGMRSGVVGKTKPEYTEKDGKIISCAVTIKRKIGKDVGEFTAEVYFSEYSTRKNQWESKPRTMIAKVAEMHALRMACPEELSQIYTSDEIEAKPSVKILEPIEKVDYEKKLKGAKNIEELKSIWSAIPFTFKAGLAKIKDDVKQSLEGKN